SGSGGCVLRCRSRKVDHGEKGVVEFAVALAYSTFFCYFENGMGIDAAARPHTRALWRTAWVHNSMTYADDVASRRYGPFERTGVLLMRSPTTSESRKRHFGRGSGGRTTRTSSRSRVASQPVFLYI